MVKKDSVDRRTVLKNLGVAAGVGVTGSSLISRADAKEAAAKVSAVTGDERKKLISAALDDASVQQITQRFADNGWEAQLADAKTLHTADAHDTVAIPFAAGDAQAVVVWTPSDAFDVAGYRFSQQAARTWEVTSYDAGVGSLSVQTETIELDPQVSCADLNWSCILSVAGAFVGSIASCGACVVDPTKFTCLGCVGAILSATGGAFGCDWCDSK